MPSKRKFYRTVFTYEVLSEEPLGEVDLEDMHAMVTEGDCSGAYIDRVSHEVGALRMVDLLAKQGSAPEFFQLDEHGNDVED